MDGRAAVGRPGERAHGRGVEPGRRPPGVRGGRARDRTPRRAAEPRCCSRPTEYPHALLEHRVAAARPQLARTTRRARAARDEVVDAGGRPLPGGAPDRRRRSSARRCTRLAPRSTRRPASTIVVNPTACRPRRSGHGQRPGRRRRCTSRRSTTARRCPTQVAAHASAARRSTPRVVGQKVRWVLEMMRGPGVRRARASAATRSSATRRRASTSRCYGVGPSEPADRPRGAARGAARSLRRGGRHVQRFRVQHPPAREVVVRR